ncbi:hypothetical protein CHS0354_028872 [Potamilus streckersoni]|uniref:Peroxidase n=1 Tax=Potamilus streckersoni TaxID=2493646 RepID=A0AAE0VI84_9BIVA|nr:hypothetical protein CHS0354_028872 [Potamilus streckersoni]
MTSTTTFLLAIAVLTCAVQATYYYDSVFANDVIASVRVALIAIAQGNTNNTITNADADNLLQLFNSGQYTDNNAVLVSKTLEILQTNFNYTATQLNTIAYHETFYAIFRSRALCVARNFFNCTGQATSVYRTLDGSCNNLDHPEWGMAFRPQRRLLNPEYNDLVSSPRIQNTNGTGNLLPNPRTISNVVHANNGSTTTLDDKITLHVLQWGQFLDHDIISTPVYTGSNGATLECCDTNQANVNTEKCIPIYVPNGDKFFINGTCMNVKRSSPALDVSCNNLTGPRQQENRITSYIDGSNVYGSSAAELIKLRNSTFPEYMAVSDGNNLPADNDNSKCTLTVTGENCSLAGDSRVNVVPSLGSYHTLFVQEHNRIVDILKTKGWTNSEELFQEARKINIAQIQRITYNEFLVWLMTRDVMNSSGLLSNVNPFTGYDPTINADIANDFGIAFRMGHSWITNEMKLHTESTETSDNIDKDSKNIEDTYLNPHMLYMRGRTGAHRMLKWLTETKCPKTDRFVEDGARNKLFLSNGVSFDLAALNINRGRDHGVPSYWKYRTELCGESLANSSSWASLTWHDTQTITQLKNVYQSPMDIDLWTGLVTEKNAPSIVGPTLSCILLAQFKALKNGDRYWFERPEPEGFSIAKVNALRQTSLSAVLCANVYPDDFVIPKNAFLEANSNQNQAVNCSQIQKLNLTPWKK